MASVMTASPHLAPVIEWQLSGKQGGLAVGAFLEQLAEILRFSGGEFSQAEVVDVQGWMRLRQALRSAVYISCENMLTASGAFVLCAALVNLLLLFSQQKPGDEAWVLVGEYRVMPSRIPAYERRIRLPEARGSRRVGDGNGGWPASPI